jgi:hypothetical protein
VSRAAAIAPRWVTFALLVAESLTVGAGAAFAHPVSMDCLHDPPAFLGTCVSQEDCNTRCVMGEGGDHGVCSPNGCCRCYL